MITSYQAVGPDDTIAGRLIEITAVVDFVSQDVLIETPDSWFLMERSEALALAQDILDSFADEGVSNEL